VVQPEPTTRIGLPDEYEKIPESDHPPARPADQEHTARDGRSLGTEMARPIIGEIVPAS